MHLLGIKGDAADRIDGHGRCVADLPQERQPPGGNPRLAARCEDMARDEIRSPELSGAACVLHGMHRCADTGKAVQRPVGVRGGIFQLPQGELDLFYTETLCHIEEAVKDTGNPVAVTDRQDIRRERFIGAFVQVLFAQDQGGGLEGADPLHLLEKGPGAKRSIGNRDDGAIIRRHSRSSPAGGRAFGGRGILRPRSARRKSRIGRRPLLRSRPSVRQSPC